MTISLWMDQLEDLSPCVPLQGELDVDVAIIGAGYTGLWTAYYLKRQAPQLRIAILEAHTAGFGASGRNGGQAIVGFASGQEPFESQLGPAKARMAWDMSLEASEARFTRGDFPRMRR